MHPLPDMIGAPLATAMTDIMTVPAGVVRQITGAQVANVDGTNPVDVTLQWVDASNGNAVTRVAYNLEIPEKDARPISVAPLALHPDDRLQAQASADGDAEILISFFDLPETA
ncbi:hypothetical protein [Epibacterium ulvae]|uniref:hypothetical protein n=1 Tax=Epibacterium ulvae TaxID=1156985 RepID=UPI002492CC4C|nr:hypothetical protein [Epibacterium ulvae]